MIPDGFFNQLNKNVNVYAAGDLVHDYIWEQYGFHTAVLNFGVEEIEKCQVENKKWEKKRFLLPSLF